MKRNKWYSRKFLLAVGVIVITIAFGLGYDLDPKLVALLVGSESALWIVVETVLDAIHAKYNGE